MKEENAYCRNEFWGERTGSFVEDDQKIFV
jgi:hypothetical protein